MAAQGRRAREKLKERMEDFARKILLNLSAGESALRRELRCGTTASLPFPTSLRRLGERAAVAAVHENSQVRILVVALRPKFLPDGFVGEKRDLPGGGLMLIGDAAENGAALVRHWPWCGASVPVGEAELRRYAPGEVKPAEFWERDDRGGYAVVAAVKSAAEVPELLQSGVTILRREVGAEAPAPPEVAKAQSAAYAGRSFLLGGGRKVEFAPGAAERIARKFGAELASVAEMARRIAGKARLELSGIGDAAEHLYWARELVLRQIEADFVLGGAENEDLADEIARRIGGHRVVRE